MQTNRSVVTFEKFFLKLFISTLDSFLMVNEVAKSIENTKNISFIMSMLMVVSCSRWLLARARLAAELAFEKQRFPLPRTIKILDV